MVEISGVALLTATIPVVAISAVGYLFRKKGWVNEDVQFGLMRLVVWVFTPAMIIDRVLGNPLLMEFSSVWKVLACGILSVAIGILLSVFAARFFGIADPARRRDFGYCAGIFNYGYIALPICISLCSPETVGMMLLFNSGCEVGIWTIGLAVVSNNLNPAKFLKAFVSPIFLTMVATVLLNFSGLYAYIPAWFCSMSKSFGACMIPSGILLVGMSLPILLNGFRWRDDKLAALGSIVMRLVVIPAVMVAVGVWLPGLPQDLRDILIIQSAMPAAMLPIVVVQYHRGDGKLALRVVMVSTIACVVTLPFWIKFGFWLLG
ncbi:MAG: AEC family transporter [Opitutae bacterium]|nr:AEC family transporter [Opitutae bacterium]